MGNRQYTDYHQYDFVVLSVFPVKTADVCYNSQMEILDKKLQKQVRIVSKRLGVPVSEVFRRAVSNYVGSIEDILSLQNELRAWDVLSAKTMHKYNF